MEENILQLKEKDAINMLHQFNEDTLPKKFGPIGKAWTALLIIVFLRVLTIHLFL